MTKNVYDDKVIVAQMITIYKAANTQEERIEAVKLISKNLSKSEASVRSKLSFLGVYIPKERTTKSGGPIVKKSELVDQIVDELGLDLTEAEATSLEKATKVTLKKLLGLKERLVGFVDE